MISKLKLLESLDQMVESLKFMFQPQGSKWSKIADFLTFLRCFFVKWEISICSAALTKKKAFWFVETKSIVVITLKTINNAMVEIHGKHILKMKMVDNFRWSFESYFWFAIRLISFNRNLQAFFLFLMSFCWEMGKDLF